MIGGAATKPQVVVFADAIGCDDITLVFDCARHGECSEMFDTRKRPGRRNNKSTDVLLGRQFSIHLGKAQIVTDTEAEMNTAELKVREAITRSKARLFFDRGNRIQMGLPIFRSDVAMRIDKNLGIVNCGAIPFRNAADDRNRKLPGDFFECGNEPTVPMIGARPDHRH